MPSVDKRNPKVKKQIEEVMKNKILMDKIKLEAMEILSEVGQDPIKALRMARKKGVELGREFGQNLKDRKK